MSQLPPAPDLSSDRPISSLSEDLLGRGSFAVAMANAFIEWKGKDSLVVALYGPWGSGKSSVKNMVLELMRKHEDVPAILEFNPWAWSGRDRIFGAFFEEVGIAIGKGSDKEHAKALATMWRKYGAHLSFAGIVVNAIKMGTQAVGIPVVPLVLEGVATGTRKASELAEGAAKAHQAASEDEPLEELKNALAESLGRLKAPLLVVMDDVDRLTREEIRTLFQLIKANADFPRVVYFLLFDRRVVEKALNEEGGRLAGSTWKRSSRRGSTCRSRIRQTWTRCSSRASTGFSTSRGANAPSTPIAGASCTTTASGRSSPPPGT